jgi:HSP20 family molecular chaperone IbpA
MYAASALFKELDDILNASNGNFETVRLKTVPYVAANKLPDSICSSRTPPSNILVNKDTGSLIIQIALPGQKKDDIKIKFENDYISVSIDKGDDSIEKVEEGGEDGKTTTAAATTEDETLVWLQKGIKPVKNTISFYVDPSRYDASLVSATFENGLLVIEVEKQTRNRKDAVISIL